MNLLKPAKITLLILIILLASLPAIATPLDDHVPGVLIVTTRPVPGVSLSSLPSPSTTLKNIKGITAIKTLPIPKPTSTPSQESIQISSSDSSGSTETYVIQVHPDHLDATIRTLQKEAWVKTIEKDYYVYIHALPNDPGLITQTYLNQTTLKALLELPTTHDTIVAMLDTGVDRFHSELTTQIALNTDEIINNQDTDQNGLVDDLYGYSFYGYTINGGSSNAIDYHSHGTHLSGIITAKTNNNHGIVGLNPKAKILNAKFLDSSGRGSQSDAAMAIYYAVAQGAKVINCSWGYSQFSGILQTAVNYAIQNGVIVVAASGNDNHGYIEYPAGFTGVITVGSVSLANNRSYFSNYGSHLDFATYGESIYSLGLNNTYTTKSGTSQSAAILTGLISLIYSVNPTLSAQQVIQILIDSCDDTGPTGQDIYTGHGIINGNKLYDLLISDSQTAQNNSDPSQHTSEAPEVFQITNLLNFPNPVSTSTTFGFDATQTGTVKIKIYTLSGRLLKEIESPFIANYTTIPWDTRDDTNALLQNGTYIYHLDFKSTQGKSTQKKGVMTIVR